MYIPFLRLDLNMYIWTAPNADSLDVVQHGEDGASASKEPKVLCVKIEDVK